MRNLSNVKDFDNILFNNLKNELFFMVQFSSAESIDANKVMYNIVTNNKIQLKIKSMLL